METFCCFVFSYSFTANTNLLQSSRGVYWLGCGVNDRGTDVCFPVSAEIISLRRSVYIDSGEDPVPYRMGTGTSFSKLKRPGRETDFSLPCSVQVKSTRSYTSGSHTFSWPDAELNTGTIFHLPLRIR
jgi:hypothetical protein